LIKGAKGSAAGVEGAIDGRKRHKAGKAVTAWGMGTGLKTAENVGSRRSSAFG